MNAADVTVRSRSFRWTAFIQLLTVGALASLACQDDSQGFTTRAVPHQLEAAADFFIPNRGQFAPDSHFYFGGASYGLHFGTSSVRLTMSPPSARPTVSRTPETRRAAQVRDRQPTRGDRHEVRVSFPGSSPVRPVGGEKADTRVSYFGSGSSTGSSSTDLPTYRQIIYPSLWPGIDLVYRSHSNGLKYDFEVTPHADVRQIRLAYRGVRGIRLLDDGDLEIDTQAGPIRDEAPVAWQWIGGTRRPVEVRYVIDELANVVRFEVGRYDRNAPLTIDPAVVVYSGLALPFRYLDDIAVDAVGAAYVVGGGNMNPDISSADVLIAKLNPDGSEFVYLCWIGGKLDDYASGIAVDGEGSAYVCGTTASWPEDGFPVVVGPDLSPGGNNDDAFVAKVSPDGTRLEYCGYIAGRDYDTAVDVAVDGQGRAYVAGTTDSDQASFPVRVGPKRRINGGRRWKRWRRPSDAWVARVAADGTKLEYCGYVGGESQDYALALAIDRLGCSYLVGVTESLRAFPPIGGVLPRGNRIPTPRFAAKISSNGKSLEYAKSLHLNGAYLDSAAVDGSGALFLAGVSDRFTRLRESRYHGGESDGLLVKIDPRGRVLELARHIGGAGHDVITGIALDSAGDLYFSGMTDSTVSTLSLQNGPGLVRGGGNDIWIGKLGNGGRTVRYGGVFGTQGWDFARKIAVDSAGNACIVGSTQGVGFPVRGGLGKYPDMGELRFNGGYPFIAKIGSLPPPGKGGGRLSVSPQELSFGSVPVGEQARRALSVTNSGSGPLIVDFPRTPPPFSLSNVGPHDLAPGESISVEVTYTPRHAAEGGIVGGMAIVSSDDRQPLVNVLLEADP
ncbi:MAG: SBBP repeat-containing protein [Armatimonadota bacterium]